MDKETITVNYKIHGEAQLPKARYQLYAKETMPPHATLPFTHSLVSSNPDKPSGGGGGCDKGVGAVALIAVAVSEKKRLKTSRGWNPLVF